MANLAHYRVRIVEYPNAEPTFTIDTSHEDPSITYAYSGDIAELVQMAQQAGEAVARTRQIPVIPFTESVE